MKSLQKRGVGAAVLAAALALAAYGYSQVPAAGKPSKPPAPHDHKALQPRPIPLGVSGGNATDSANGYCCSGTLGALVVDSNGQQYILSNTHVFAHDITAGDLDGVAEAGDDINQPGLVDSGCTANTDYVAKLSHWAPLDGTANVDAAIAEVESGAVDPGGAILEIGPIAATPASAFINQRVKKSGRTTGLTSSSVTDINVTIEVGYTDECGGATFTKTFTGQIFVQNRASKFLAAGDSGSLMVQNRPVSPAPIGLLFAGSSSVAVANPIGAVLDYLHVQMVGVGATGLASTDAAEAPSRAEVARAQRAQERHSDALLKIPRGVGHGIGLDGGRVVIKVFVEEITDEARRAVPDSIDGVPVVLEAVGRIIAF